LSYLCSRVLEGVAGLLAALDGGQARFFQRVCQDLAKRSELNTPLARKLEAAMTAADGRLAAGAWVLYAEVAQHAPKSIDAHALERTWAVMAAGPATVPLLGPRRCPSYAPPPPPHTGALTRVGGLVPHPTERSPSAFHLVRCVALTAHTFPAPMAMRFLGTHAHSVPHPRPSTQLTRPRVQPSWTACWRRLRCRCRWWPWPSKLCLRYVRRCGWRPSQGGGRHTGAD
jgi:hypothetical protein